MEIVCSRTEDIKIGVHGFSKSAFDALPGKIGISPKGTTWKTMILGDVEISFFQNDL